MESRTGRSKDMSETIHLTQLPVSNFQLGESGIQITYNALKVFKEAVQAENKEYVRIGVKGGGCSGFMYNLEFIEENEIDQEEDAVFASPISSQKLIFVVDLFSMQYLKGTVIDHVNSLNETGFKFENPSAKKTCGCRI